MRKIVFIIVFVFLLTWTYNLFINNFIVLEEAEEEPYKGVITIWDIPRDNMGKGYHKWLADRIINFEKRNPGVYIEIDIIDEERLQLITKDKEFQTNEPDIISVNTNFSDFHILEQIDGYFNRDELEQFRYNILKALSPNKILVAVPVGLSTNVIYVNLDCFYEKGLGIPTNGDLTYDEFTHSLKQFIDNRDGNGVMEPYAFISSIGQGNYNIWGILLSDGAEIINPKRIEYNFYGEKAIRGLEKVMDLKDKHGIVPGYFGIINDKDAWEMFFKDKKVAIIIEGAWACNILEKTYRDGDGFSFDIMNYPIGEKGLPIVLSNDIVSYGIIKKDDNKKMEICLKFLKYLTSEYSQRSLEGIGLFTVRRGIKDMYKENIKMKKIEESINYTEYIPLMEDWVKIDAIVQEEIRKAIMGEKASYEAIEDAKMEIDRLKKQEE